MCGQGRRRPLRHPSSTGAGRYESRMGSVIAVSGAVGGIGTSTLAYALALQAGSAAVLIDARPSGVPLELLIGGESEPGTRWHQIHIANAGIDPATVRNALPQWNGVRFLSANRFGTAHLPALTHLVTVLRNVPGQLIVDVDARSSILDALQPDLHVLMVPNTIYGLGAAVPCLREHTALVIVRTHLEDFRTEEIGRYLSQPVYGTIEHERSVWVALRARAPLPMNASVMKTAQHIIASEVADAA